MIIAGTAIGAGMLANPSATSGLWFVGSLFLLAYVWLCMCLSGLLLLEANLRFPPGASYHTLVKELLGPVWNLVCGLSIAFVLYSLTYAYIFVGGGLTQQSLNLLSLELSRTSAAILFLIVFASCVASSTRWVSRLSTLLIGGMLITFVLANAGLLQQLKAEVLFNHQGELVYWRYAWLALPVCLASFGFHGNVPSLVSYYRGNAQAVRFSIIIGSSLALVVYGLWQLAILGNLPRTQFAPVLAADGDVAALLNALSAHINTQGLSQFLDAFAFMAIISSFLGVTLGLFDYMRDLLGFEHTPSGRIKTALVTFLPPLVAYLFFPTGFIKVMGYIGLAAAIWAVLVPALLAYKSRQRFGTSGNYQVVGGVFTIAWVVLFAVLVIITQLLLLWGKLPVFTG